MLADALTSVLAIAGLVAGSVYGWVWMDPAVGILGALVITRWSIGLMRDSGAVLLDAVDDPKLTTEIRTALEQSGDRLTDLHVWRVGPGHSAAVMSVVTHHPAAPGVYKQRLGQLQGLCHDTIEVNECG